VCVRDTPLGVPDELDEADVELAAPGVPEDPPAALESWAKPIESGDALNTVYTFFKKASPTTQAGFPPPETTLDPRLRSKMLPIHWPLLAGPKLMSASLMGHD